MVLRNLYEVGKSGAQDNFSQRVQSTGDSGLIQYLLGRCPDRMIAIGRRLSIINLVTSFLRDLSILNSIGGRCTRDSGYVAKAGDLNRRLVVM